MLRLSSLSTEYVKVPVAVLVNGQPYNPTGDTVSMAIILGAGANPGPSDWFPATWETAVAATTVYLARLLVGPLGALQLTQIQVPYYVWVKIASATGETVVRQVGIAEVY